MKIYMRNEDQIKKLSGGYLRFFFSEVDSYQEAEQFIYDTFGTSSTESGTVGQYAQEKNIQERGACSLGVNFYYFPKREVKKKLKELIAKGKIQFME